MDETYRRFRYVRYADDFLIGVIGSKADCVKIKSDITNYMEENLKLELSQEKTLITNAQTPAKFLGFEVSVRKSDALNLLPFASQFHILIPKPVFIFI